MPELPEVETIVRDLARSLPGSTIARVEVLKPDLIGGDAAAFVRGLTSSRIRGVTRRAKNIVFDLGAHRLVVNLGMTGRLLMSGDAGEQPTHIGVTFRLASERTLVYHDVRRFGCLEYMTAGEWEDRETAFGPEPLSDDFTAAELYDLSRGSRVAVKTWLMDQRRVVGVGNIYASESLHRARVDPRRAANSLSRGDANAVHRAIRETLLEAIEFRGTTLLDYRDASGAPGGFSARLRVYDRAGEPCAVCGTAIERIVQGGRSTFFCPVCQS
jgi:formamidopyrimidine-DNA glycosylase